MAGGDEVAMVVGGITLDGRGMGCIDSDNCGGFHLRLQRYLPREKIGAQMLSCQ